MEIYEAQAKRLVDLHLRNAATMSAGLHLGRQKRIGLVYANDLADACGVVRAYRSSVRALVYIARP